MVAPGKLCGDNTRMKRIGRHLNAVRKTLGKFKGEKNICELRLAVRKPVVVVSREVYVVEVDVTEQMSAGRDVYYPRRPAPARTTSASQVFSPHGRLKSIRLAFSSARSVYRDISSARVVRHTSSSLTQQHARLPRLRDI
jgi:hypothetical protein